MKASVLAIAMTCTFAVIAQSSAEQPKEQPQAMPISLRLPVEGRMPAFKGATEWLNSPPLTPAGLQGKVVLVDFWTYTCINWLRTLPYVRAWAEKYKDKGLVVVSVHTPEFEFEKNLDNVQRAVHSMEIGFPIAVDSDYAIWRAFQNEYWPALYFVDAQGRIRHHRFGEGEYEESEAVIRQLLTEAGAKDLDSKPAAIVAHGAEVAADWSTLRSGENYVGYARTNGFASPGGFDEDRTKRYSVPSRLRLNHWALAGDWNAGRGSVASSVSNARLVYRFHARDLHLVMGPAMRGKTVRFQVRIDGQPPGAAHGVDIDESGRGTVTEPRLYQLIRQPAPVIEREVEIEFIDPGVEAFSFTFG